MLVIYTYIYTHIHIYSFFKLSDGFTDVYLFFSHKNLPMQNVQKYIYTHTLIYLHVCVHEARPTDPQLATVRISSATDGIHSTHTQPWPPAGPQPLLRVLQFLSPAVKYSICEAHLKIQLLFTCLKEHTAVVSIYNKGYQLVKDIYTHKNLCLYIYTHIYMLIYTYIIHAYF